MNNNENYFKDNFTKEGEKVNLEVNKLTLECLTSKNNTFGLDSEGNLNVKSITTIEPIIQSTINMLYPIGSIYMNVNDCNPSEILGGTWEQIQDKFLLACGSTYANGSIGGNATHNHTTGSHTLTIDEIPSHGHLLWYHSHNGSGDSGSGIPFTGDGTYVGRDDRGVIPTGGSQPHNHGNTSTASTMPPYLAVYVWKRVA